MEELSLTKHLNKLSDEELYERLKRLEKFLPTASREGGEQSEHKKAFDEYCAIVDIEQRRYDEKYEPRRV